MGNLRNDVVFPKEEEDEEDDVEEEVEEEEEDTIEVQKQVKFIR